MNVRYATPPASTARLAYARVLPGLASLAVALALLACGGDKEETADADTPETANPTSAPAATARPGASPAPSATSRSSSSSSTLSGRLPDLNSYKYAFKLEGTAGLIAEISDSTLPSSINPNTGTATFEAKGSYIKPDKGEATLSFAGTSVTRVVIGRQQWTTIGGVTQGPAQISSTNDETYSFVASFWDSSATEALKDFTCGSGRENVNGVSTRKCTAEKSTIQRLNQEGKLFTTGQLDLKEFSNGSAEIWVAEGDKVIRFRANIAGKDSSNRNVVFKMEVDISDINGSFSINPPRN
jgi:hypothetical protein